MVASDGGKLGGDVHDPDVPAEGCELAGRIHDRMPVILPEDRIDEWIFGGEREPDELKSLLTPTAENYLVVRPVSQRVNSVRNDGPDLIEELMAESGEQLGLFRGA